MKFAVISDIHGNLEALRTVKDKINLDKDIKKVFCLGDIVGYYPAPAECIQIVQELCGSSNIIAGNHDTIAVSDQFEKDISYFNRYARNSLKWTRAKLENHPKEWDFLKNLLENKVIEITNDGKCILLAHGSPEEKYEYIFYFKGVKHKRDFNSQRFVFTSNSDELYERKFEEWLKKWKVDFVAIGHTHIPFVFSQKRQIVFNPGSVGQPRDGINKASYATIELTDDIPKVIIHRIAYDIKTTSQLTLKANLDKMLAERLWLGQ